MSRRAKLFVRQSAQEERSALSDLVMAWARDIETGEARYILELGPERRGAKSGCQCAHCGLPLTAVNAAKAEFIKRPHFRHPEGAAESVTCRVLAARGAILRALRDEGWIQLPGRRRSSRFAGLSGDAYDAHAEYPAERRRITDLDLRDRALAVLTLDDGRTVRVLLTGSANGTADVLDADGLPVPTLVMDVAEAGVAAMSPEDIRKRLSLLPERLTWVRHWRDAELDEQARHAAFADAASHFDAAVGGEQVPSDQEPTETRAHLLREAVGAVLLAAGRIWVPGWAAVARTADRFGRNTGDKKVSVPPHWVQLLKDADGGDSLKFTAQPVFEGASRMEPLVVHLAGDPTGPTRGRGTNVLEIDLTCAGRGLTTASLHGIVVDALLPKRWLAVEQQKQLEERLRLELEEEEVRQAAARVATQLDLDERCARLRNLTFDELVNEYLLAARDWFDELAVDRGGLDGSELKAARARFDAARRLLKQHGYPEADAEQFADAHGLLVGLLSIRLGRPLAGIRTMGDVLAAHLPHRVNTTFPNHTLFLIALHVFSPPLSSEEKEFAEEWATRVRESLRRGEEEYERTGVYDRVIALLLPEMSGGLEKRAGRRPRPHERADSEGQYSYKPGDEQFRAR
jgi:hypothetical protein